MKKQSFLTGSLLLTASALTAKLLGALFKIPLTAMLGGTGMGYFSCAYGLFLPLYAVFVTGVSTAVARPTADHAGKGNFSAARYVRKVARTLFFWTGLVGTLLAAGFAKGFAARTSPGSYPSVLAITPAVLLCCLTAVERGYYEGLCSMTPTAVSQAVEALAKLVCGLICCSFFLRHPLPGMTREAAGAFGAVLGVTVSTLAGLLCMVFRNCLGRQDTAGSQPHPSAGTVIRLLLSVMIPAALGALVTNLTSLIDLMTVMRCFSELLRTDPEAFYRGAALSESIPPEEAAAFVYGSFMGLSVTVFNLVPSLTNMLAKGVLPCTAQAWASGSRREAAGYARQVLLLTGLAAIPAGCGIFVLARGVLEFLFAGREAEIDAAVSSLQWLAPGMVFLCMTFPVFSLLQAVGKEKLPVLLMLPGIAVKLVGNILLIPYLYTAGAALSTSLCYLVILIPALICLRKALGETLQLTGILTAQCYSGAMCAAAAWLCYTRSPFPQRLSLLLAVAAGVGVYVICMLLCARRTLTQMLLPAARYTCDPDT